MNVACTVARQSRKKNSIMPVPDDPQGQYQQGMTLLSSVSQCLGEPVLQIMYNSPGALKKAGTGAPGGHELPNRARKGTFEEKVLCCF
jgi:hypothetical protein